MEFTTYESRTMSKRDIVELYIMVSRTLLWWCWASLKENEVFSVMNERTTFDATKFMVYLLGWIGATEVMVYLSILTINMKII
jgi:hypothetical protein